MMNIQAPTLLPLLLLLLRSTLRTPTGGLPGARVAGCDVC
jgi:hypothetical protein